MTERIKAVQRAFWTLLAVGLGVAVLGIPFRDDGGTMAALSELQAFDAGFNRKSLEHVLLSHASAQGVVGLDSVVRAMTGPGVPKVSVAPNAQPIAPRAAVPLETLAEVNALTAPSATLAIGTPSGGALGLALAWRLSRQPAGESYVLQSVALEDGRCSAADVARESEVANARQTALRARDQAKIAEKQHAQAQDVYDLRRKWKATWKAIAKANETRQKALETLEDAQKQAAAADQAYEALAKQAESASAASQADKDAPKAKSGDCAVAVAKLSSPGKPLELRVPVAIEQRQVPVPRITGADFSVLRSQGLWNELKDENAAQAMAQVRARFSWHYRYLELSGVKLGGMTVLQLAPLVFLPLFLGLIRRSRGVGATYNPFDRPAAEVLPTVGLGIDAINLVILVVLPLAGCVLCTWSLLQVEQAPIVPVLCALLAIGLGGSSHLALKELLELRDAITRSHSNPPPAPTAPAG